MEKRTYKCYRPYKRSELLKIDCGALKKAINTTLPGETYTSIGAGLNASPGTVWNWLNRGTIPQKELKELCVLIGRDPSEFIIEKRSANSFTAPEHNDWMAKVKADKVTDERLKNDAEEEIKQADCPNPADEQTTPTDGNETPAADNVLRLGFSTQEKNNRILVSLVVLALSGEPFYKQIVDRISDIEITATVGDLTKMVTEASAFELCKHLYKERK